MIKKELALGSYPNLARKTLSFSSMIIAAIALSGCALVGSNNIAGRGFDYSISTAATNTVQADNSQAMPSNLDAQQNKDVLVATSPSKYLPPANIGSIIKAQDVEKASPIENDFNVVSSTLPPLPKNENLGSKDNMSAQTMPQTSNVNVATIEPVQKPTNKPLPENTYFHTIESGESLFSIAKKYSVTVASIVSANNLVSADRIYVGQKLAIPGRSDLVVAKAPAKIKNTPTLSPVKRNAPAQAQNKQEEQQAPTKITAKAQNDKKVKVATLKPAQNPSSDKFIWPARGEIIVDFAGSKNTGINIAVPEGSAVKSAKSGTVIYVGDAVEGYGNLILIKHDNGYVTAYAHLSKINVAKGEKVAAGQTIGLAGQTGSVNRPQLHFELRKGATPVNPIPMLQS